MVCATHRQTEKHTSHPVLAYLSIRSPYQISSPRKLSPSLCTPLTSKRKNRGKGQRNRESKGTAACLLIVQHNITLIRLPQKRIKKNASLSRYPGGGHGNGWVSIEKLRVVQVS
jgi:hypothetical protein